MRSNVERRRKCVYGVQVQERVTRYSSKTLLSSFSEQQGKSGRKHSVQGGNADAYTNLGPACAIRRRQCYDYLTLRIGALLSAYRGLKVRVTCTQP